MTRLDLRVGDVIDLTARVTIDAPIDADDHGCWIALGTDGLGVAWQVNHPSVKVKPVKLVSRRPKVGDVITGEELKARKWKRGTIIRATPGATYVLMGDGCWYRVEAESLHFPCAFSDFLDREEIEIVRLPD